MSAYLNEEIANAAIEHALPSIKRAMKTGLAKREDGHIVISVREPGRLNWTRLVEHSLGAKLYWAHPYDEIARQKDQISRRTGLTTRQVQQMQPELSVTGDTIYYGNAMQSGIIVSYSGVDAFIDEMFANIILQFCLGLIRKQLADHIAKGNTEYNLVKE
jgi:hypothetical protein